MRKIEYAIFAVSVHVCITHKSSSLVISKWLVIFYTWFLNMMCSWCASYVQPWIYDTISRKTVGNFIAGTDTSSSNKGAGNNPQASSAVQGYDERNAPHTKLPVDQYYYPGPRYCYYLMDVEVTRVGHCK